MAKLDRAALKAFFETGDKPTQAQFGDFIDSVLNLVETSELEATITLNIPVFGTGVGGKVITKGNAIIQIGEYSDNETIISSDDGAFTTGTTAYFGDIQASITFNGFDGVLLDVDSSEFGFSTGAKIICNNFGGNETINLFCEDKLILGKSLAKLGFFAHDPTVGIQTITGSRGGNAALTNLLTALENYNLIIDNTTI